MTFEKWLKKQKKRNDPVGDLARDFIEVNRLYKTKDKCDKDHLRKHNAISACYIALEIARDEWEKECGL